MKIRAYLVVFDSKENGIRYLCKHHAKEIIEFQDKFARSITLIHSDVYNKKCHLCK